MRISDWSSDVCSSDLRFLRTSTVTALVRPWLKLWRTCPVSTVFFSSSRLGRAAVLSLSCSFTSLILVRFRLPLHNFFIPGPTSGHALGTAGGGPSTIHRQIGRESCREGVWPYV